ncbi:TldD/PmbA family protein [Fusobacterium perfoetens]|uniref:TldD/PmbA family protein n=1 Tax=Fusobacterium perfoetens TaxID=852 RepID=UPI001F3B4308|nr:TldD/PmbA family protein [Fusobacterium perfoetens]MCF2612822.1 TldD/PmbA family protein [Fusobacterium perfoetens]
MEKNIFIDKLFEKASLKGIDEFEIYFLSNLNTSIKIYQGKIENFSNNQNQGISFRGMVDGKMGYSYSESMEDEDIDFLINEVIENASCIESLDKQFIYGEKANYTDTITYSSAIENLDTDLVKDFLIKMEEYALSIDERVKKVNFCSFAMGSGEKIIKNSKGLELHSKENICYTYISVVAQENGVVKTGSHFQIGRDFSKFDYKTLSEVAVKRALNKSGAITLSEVPKTCVIENLAFSSLLGAMSNIFSAEAVQKNISKLKGKLNEAVASSIVTLVDDPFLKDGLANSSFDDEGVPTSYKEIIQDGILKTYLYNLKTAYKDGVSSTGNGVKGSYKGTVGISSFNLYIKPSSKSFDKMIENIKEGIFITDFAGLHSGLNTISGDFSLAGEGFYIKDGKIDRPLNQITISGNFFELLKNIKDIANDIKFSFSSVGSPSIMVEGLKVVAD